MTRSGYYFDGWWTGENGTGNRITYSTIFNTASDQTLYAHWIPEFQVSFDVEGGEPLSNGTIIVRQGAEYGSLPTTTKEDFIFTYWWTGTNQTGMKITESTIVDLTEDQILYAGWALQHTVTFDSQGGSTPSPESIIVGEGLNYGSLPTTERIGYVFDGWWTGTGGTGEQITETSLVTTSPSQVLYAKWYKLYAIGATGPAGGLVFYDKGSYSNGWRYLEAAPAGWGGTSDDPSYIFGYYRTTDDGTNEVVGTETAIGTGETNTIALVSKMGDTAYKYESGNEKGNYAAKACADLVVNKDGVAYDDWFLPSKDELSLIYQNLYRKGLGGFSDSYYFKSWSSSEYDGNNAWFQIFNDGNQNCYYRYVEVRVRPVRAF